MAAGALFMFTAQVFVLPIGLLISIFLARRWDLVTMACTPSPF
jgi:hypothetical protein